ncbi:tellurite resistance TerB family protein [Thiosocius teredinicola]|uniref:tellurite resistance TerB family protein n=1 Tax=Thiosocius teredinicola TaxID=1973002 RepID=UPI000990A12A
MFDAKRLLDQFVGSGAAGGFAGGLAGGVLGNLLAGKKASKMAGNALKLGGLALVGGLAYKAWQNYQANGNVMPQAGVDVPPEDGAFLPRQNDAAGAQALSMLLARSMIMAAKADGQIDTAESQAIMNQINGLDLPADDKAFLFEEYGKPLDIDGLAKSVDSPEHAAEVYAASALMLDSPTPPEKIYLDTLAGALGLQPGLAQQIQATVDANRTT